MVVELRLLVERKLRIPSAKLIEVLLDPDLVASNTPYVVGISKGKITLLFKRFLLAGFRDEYSLFIEGSKAENRAVHIYKGTKSTILIEYRGVEGSIKAFGEYRGPRRWIVAGKLREIAVSIITGAEKIASSSRGAESTINYYADYSKMLSSLSWVSKLVMKSILVKNEIRTMPSGGLLTYIEEVVSSGVTKRYPIVYVSGTAENASFRLLFVEGELRGVYAVVDGKEIVGDDSALNYAKGLTRIRVYASLTKQLLGVA